MSTAPPPPPPPGSGDQPGRTPEQQPAEPQQGFPPPGPPYPEQSQSQQPPAQQPGSPYGQQAPHPGGQQQPYPQQPHGQYGPPSGGQGGPSLRLSPSEERTWSILAHLSAPISFLLSSGLLNFVGPLIIWAIYKDRSPLVRNASAGSFNFNLSVWVVNIAFGIFALVTLGFGLIIAIPVWIVTFVVAAVLHIMAAVKASNGEAYTYPLQLPILK
ncbi:MAG: DUF4870 domain-containing protein [Ornithinimicrobium sp.]|uniref:DUF4870 domain-containing protein n=1 Tax=Ornithinimicrobium sp. TaxID=1977084 RepID=UPI003D9BC2E9